MRIFNKKSYFIVFLTLFLFFSCESNVLPKPYGQLRLEYPQPNYEKTNLDCPFEFEKSIYAKVEKRKENCWFTISYPKMKAKINVTYFPVKNNFQTIVKESQKLVYEHSIRAASIETKTFQYAQKKVFGNLYKLSGESASNLQFYVTDSTKHFVEANVYFQTRPKPDSLAPAINYIANDALRMIETFHWKK